LPAYQYMRLSEESGIPPSFGNVNMTEQHLIRAAAWCGEHDQCRTQSLMFRLLTKKVTESYLNRHQVAALAPETVTRWRAAAVRATRTALRDAGHEVRTESDIE